MPIAKDQKRKTTSSFDARRTASRRNGHCPCIFERVGNRSTAELDTPRRFSVVPNGGIAEEGGP